MSEPTVPLKVFTTFSTQAVRIPKWKHWNLTFGFAENWQTGILSVHVGDVANILNYDQSPQYRTVTTVDALSALARDLEDFWSQYSHGSKALQAQPQNLAAIGRDIFNELFPSNPKDPEALSNLVAEAIRDSAARWIEAWKKGPEASEEEKPENKEAHADAKKKKAKEWPLPALSLAFYSDNLHLPWNLLYPFQDFSTYQEMGFLGLGFSIEEMSNFQYDKTTLKKAWGTVPPIGVSLQLDLNINGVVHETVSSGFAEYGETSVKVARRSQSEDFKNALIAKTANEEIMYFCCHTTERPPQLRLTDPEPISAVAILELTKRADLQQWPVIFLNTCWGAVLHNRYRTSFVEAFMRGGAVAVIGAEAEIEENFAASFASKFFRRLFEVENGDESLGDVAYRIRLGLWTKPFGIASLLYSVYSRIPVRFRRTELGKKESAPVQAGDSEENKGKEGRHG